MTVARQRRRTPRVEGPWTAQYRTGRPGRWERCGVLDLSAGGAALALPPDVGVLGATLELDLGPLDHGRHPLVLRADVRGGYVLPDGTHRVGVRFTNARGRRQRRLFRLLRRM